MTYFQDIFEIKTVNLVKNNNLLQITYFITPKRFLKKKRKYCMQLLIYPVLNVLFWEMETRT